MESFKRGDVPGFIDLVGYHGLAVVFDNVDALKSRGIYEEALIEGYRWHNGSTHKWTTDEIEGLFKVANRARLRALNPLPSNADDLTVYRGVHGLRHERRDDGLSWTSDLNEACWFALKGEDIYPTVYEANILTDDAYCYIAEESEVVCRPTGFTRAKLALGEMKDRRLRAHPRLALRH